MRPFVRKGPEHTVIDVISDEIWNALTVEEQNFLFTIERHQRERSSFPAFKDQLGDARRLMAMAYGRPTLGSDDTVGT